jgi:alpha-tubulin suppressor-like RCC1 family protein
MYPERIPRTGGRALALVVGSGLFCACLNDQDRTVTRAWLRCEECVDGELEALKERGDRVVPLLARALDGPPDYRDTNVRHQLERTYAELKQRVTAKGDTLQVDSARYVNHYLENYRALYQSRAITGLAAIGTSKAQEELVNGRNRVNSHDLTLRADVDSELTVAVQGRWLWVAAGNRASCGIRADHRAYCWGVNNTGQLGDGTTNRSLKPRAVQGDLQFSYLTMGSGSHVCGIADRFAYCWGANGKGQLGDGTETERHTPTRVASDSLFTGIAVGAEHSCGSTPGNRGLCWGENAAGQLGDATTTRRSTPVFVTNDLGLVRIRAGGTHTCADSLNQVLYCWGSNDRGQLAISATGNRNEPTRSPPPAPTKAVSLGSFHTCILTFANPAVFEGSAYCAGRNDRGQLGDGTTADKPTLTKVADGLYSEISAGEDHTCAIAFRTRVVSCWGGNGFGQLGNGSTTPQPTPVPVAGPVRFLTVSAGSGHTCGISTKGLAYCWGHNDTGQLGDGGTGDRNTPTLVSPP